MFRDLLQGPNSAYLRSPFNDVARLEAGFSVEELALIRQMEEEYRSGIKLPVNQCGKWEQNA